MAKVIKTKEIVKEVAINPATSRNVIIIGTELSQYLKTGKEYLVNSKLAKTLVQKGSAIYKQ